MTTPPDSETPKLMRCPDCEAPRDICEADPCDAEYKLQYHTPPDTETPTTAPGWAAAAVDGWNGRSRNTLKGHVTAALHAYGDQRYDQGERDARERLEAQVRVMARLPSMSSAESGVLLQLADAMRTTTTTTTEGK